MPDTMYQAVSMHHTSGLRHPKGMTSWDFFDYLLDKANVVGTPGSGFGSDCIRNI